MASRGYFSAPDDAMDSPDAMHPWARQALAAAVRASFAARVPLGRYATNEEIAAMAAFLVSDDSAYCNGASFVVDGGMLTA